MIRNLGWRIFVATTLFYAPIPGRFFQELAAERLKP